MTYDKNNRQSLEVRVKRRLKKGLRYLFLFFFADKIIGKYNNIKSKNHRVNLFDYHPEVEFDNRYNNSRWNLGDYLGFVVTSWMLEKKGLSLDSWVKKRKHFNCIGSNVFSGFQHITYWGSGLKINANYSFLYRFPFCHYDFRAVRGPLTREIVLKYGHKCPEVYGDPAILMPFIYQPSIEKTHDILVIPQFVNEVAFRQEHPDLFMVSMNTNDYRAVIDAIVSSRKVLTSSLHAIILSESYGVPAIWYRGLPEYKDFKYLDYYYSTGRRNIKIANSYEEALKIDPLPLPDLSALQEGLLKTFPYDLWEE